MGLFGKKTADQSSTLVVEPEPKAPPTPPASGLRRKWGVLVVADSVVTLFFLVSFCVVSYLKMAAPPLPEVTRPPGLRKAEAQAAHAPKDEPKPETPAAPKNEAVAPQAPKKEEKVFAKDRPTGSPAVHAAALPKRSLEPMATPAKVEKTAALKVEKPALVPGAKPRALAVEFTHKASTAKDVVLRGAFLVRTRGKMPMVKDSSGVWHASLSLLPGSYKFSFVVDGKPTAAETRVIE